MDACLSDTDSKNLKRRWLQFHLRSLIVLAMFGAVCCGLSISRGTEEEQLWVHEKYGNAPILGPLAPGHAVYGLEPPSDDAVIAALDRDFPTPESAMSFFEHSRSNFNIERVM